VIISDDDDLRHIASEHSPLRPSNLVGLDHEASEISEQISKANESNLFGPHSEQGSLFLSKRSKNDAESISRLSEGS